MSPEEMIELVFADENSEFSQELLNAFRNGYPIENLRPLLVSSLPHVRSLGSYLVYELNVKARPLFDDIVPLLDSDCPQMRSDAIYTLLDCATQFDADALGKVISLLDDPDPFVQRGAMHFVQRCERPQLNVGVNMAAELNPGTAFVEFPRFIGKDFYNYRAITRETLERLMAHDSAIAKRFAVGLACRPRLIVDESFLDIAARCDDEECRGVLDYTRNHPFPTGAVCMKL